MRDGLGDGESQWPRQPPGGTITEPDDHALGRSRGGLSTKLHLACEQGHTPLSMVVTAGQRGDAPQFAAVMAGIRVARPGRGRPRTRPDRVRGRQGLLFPRSGPICAGAVSDTPFRFRMTRLVTGCAGVAAVAARRPLTVTTTATVMPWSAASTGSNATGR